MEENIDTQQKIEKIEAELSYLDHHRVQLLDELLQLRQELLQKNSSAQLQETSINNQSPQEDKIRLFRSLFKGREDVFPRRFENSKTGKSGYAPVCRNEWNALICQKPKKEVARIVIPVRSYRSAMKLFVITLKGKVQPTMWVEILLLVFIPY